MPGLRRNIGSRATCNAGPRSTRANTPADLAVEPGEVVSLAGPDGSGKSALLRSMLPDTNKRDGALLVDAYGRVFPRRGPVAFRRGVSGLRTGIKRAPQLLLLDEPVPLFAGDDGRDVFGRMLADYPGTVVMTAASLDDASVADRIAVVDAGTIAQTGTRRELFDRPRTRFVAAAAGTNFFTALARSGKLLIGHSTISAPTNLDGRVLVTLPPNAVTLHATDPQAADPRGADPRGADPRGADPRGADPRDAALREADSHEAAPQKNAPHAMNVFAARVIRLSPDTVGLSPVDPERGLELDATADPSSDWRLGQPVFASVDVDRITAYPF